MKTIKVKITYNPKKFKYPNEPLMMCESIIAALKDYHAKGSFSKAELITNKK